MALTLRLAYMDKMLPLARLGKLRDVEKAFAQYQQCDGSQPDQIMFNLVLYACVKNRNFDACNTWLRAMVDASVSPDEVSFRTIIGGVSELREAWRWFHHMEKFGIKPGVRTFNTMLRSVRTIADANGVRDIMATQNVLPDDITYSILLKIAAYDPAAIQEVSTLFALIDPRKLTSYHYNLLIRTMSANDQERVLERMLHLGMDIESIALRVISTYSASCEPPFDMRICSEEAFKLVKKMDSWGVALSTKVCNALMSPLIRHWRTISLSIRHREIAFWREHMAQHGIAPDASTHHLWMIALQDDLASVEKLMGSAPLGKSFLLLAQIYAREGDIASVEDLWRRQHHIAVGLVLMRAYADNSQGVEGLALFHEMVQRDVWVTNKATTDVLRACVGIPTAERLLSDLG